MKPLALILFALSAFAQTAIPAPDVNQCPAIILGAGGGVVRNAGQASTGEGWTAALLHLGGCNFVGTNIDMAQINGVAANTMRAEYSRLFPFGRISDGTAKFLVGPVISAGTATTPPMIGSFAGGFFFGANMGTVSPRLSGLMLTAEARLTGTTQTVSTATSVANGITTTTTVQQTPTNQMGQVSVGLYIGVGYTFRGSK